MVEDMVEDLVEDMAEHPPLLSMPFSFSEGMTTGNNIARGVNTEDWDALFAFRFSSCSKCGLYGVLQPIKTKNLDVFNCESKTGYRLSQY
jgi:hypothetical protein